jgi:hypothetical protein
MRSAETDVLDRRKLEYPLADLSALSTDVRLVEQTNEEEEIPSGKQARAREHQRPANAS